MTSFDELIAQGMQLQSRVEEVYERNYIPSKLSSEIKAFHVQGRFLLKKVDRSTNQEFSSLFAKTPNDIPRWDHWNRYIKEELDKAVGILIAVKESGKEALDTSLVRVFISHGKFTPAFTKIETFLRALGCIPVYDTDEPTEGRTINQHVEKLFAESDFYIILATHETTNDRGDRLPNHNVLIEYDRLIKADTQKMLVLLETGVRMPSMVQDVVYHPFSQECMDGAFTQLVRELNRHNLL